MAGLSHAGIGRYTQELIRHLPLDDPGTRWVLFFSSPEQAVDVLGQKVFRQLSLRQSIVYLAVPHYTLREQLQLPFAFLAQRLDLLHVPHFNVPLLYPGKIVITIHDLLWHEHRGGAVTSLPGWLYWLKYSFYRLVVRISVWRASQIMVPAQTVSKTVIKYFPFAKRKIVVTPEGIDTSFTKIKRQDKPASRQLLYVGSLYPHKNVQLIIRAMNTLPSYTLDIVSVRGVFLDRMKAFVATQPAKNQVTFKGFLPDPQLKSLMSQVFALVQPSLYEGFGLPVLEAMAAGVPALVSDIPIFHEVYQDGVFYFDPHSTSSFVKAVTRMADMTVLQRQRLSRKAREIASTYTWDKMATATLKTYDKCLSV